MTARARAAPPSSAATRRTAARTISAATSSARQGSPPTTSGTSSPRREVTSRPTPSGSRAARSSASSAVPGPCRRSRGARSRAGSRLRRRRGGPARPGGRRSAAPRPRPSSRPGRCRGRNSPCSPRHPLDRTRPLRRQVEHTEPFGVIDEKVEANPPSGCRWSRWVRTPRVGNRGSIEITIGGWSNAPAGAGGVAGETPMAGPFGVPTVRLNAGVPCSPESRTPDAHRGVTMPVTEAKTILQFLLDLLRDPNTQAAFAENPRARSRPPGPRQHVLRRHCRDALPLVMDHAPTTSRRPHYDDDLRAGTASTAAVVSDPDHHWDRPAWHHDGQAGHHWHPAPARHATGDRQGRLAPELGHEQLLVRLPRHDVLDRPQPAHHRQR